jgi:rod shape-determining protein MreD
MRPALMARRPIARSTGPWRQLDIAARYAFPTGSLVLGLFVIGMPFDLPGQAELWPVFTLSCVYFWSLYRPASLPAPVVVLVGLLLGLLNLSPLGLWAVLLLMLQGVVLAVRRRLAPQPFLLTWLAFCGLAVTAAGLAWMLESLLILKMLPVQPLLIEALFSVGLYPVVAGLFIRAHRGPAAVELA